MTEEELFAGLDPRVIHYVTESLRLIDTPAGRMQWLLSVQKDVERLLAGATTEVVQVADLPELRNAMVRWKWRPVPIQTFVEHDHFLGLKGEVYPKVMDLLVEATTGGYSQVVLTGAIGWGKSFAADLLLTYSNIYLPSCLVDPQREYGLATGTSIIVIQQSLNLRLAKKVLFDQVARLIRKSPYFQAQCPYDRTLKSELVFANGVRLEPVAGNEVAAIGMAVIGGIIDETNFMSVIEGSKRVAGGSSQDVYDQAVANYNAIANRIQSRFMRFGQLPGQLILVSSKRYPEDFTERKIREAREDPSILVADKAQWETRPDRYLGPTFRVLIPGAQLSRARVLADDEPEPGLAADEVLQVPIEYRKAFENDIDQALREIAGRSTLTIHAFIPRRDMIAAMARPGRQHPFSRQVTTLRDGLLILPELLHLDVDAPRAIHLDLSKGAHDPTGFAMGYVSGFLRVERAAVDVQAVLTDDVEVIERDGMQLYVEHLPVVTLEALLRIEAPANDEIEAEEIIELIVKLRDVAGVPIRWVTADQFQSMQSLQMLRRRGFITGEQSVDKDPRPYGDLKAAIYDQRVDTYAYQPLVDELSTLERNEKTGKVDHPQWAITSDGRKVPGRKDVADAAAGVTFLLMRRRESWAVSESGRPQRPHLVRA